MGILSDVEKLVRDWSVEVADCRLACGESDADSLAMRNVESGFRSLLHEVALLEQQAKTILNKYAL